MTRLAPSLRAFLHAWPDVAMVEVAGAKGSTPREQGAWMLASPGAIFGTIGGGQLEYMATDAARQTLGCGFSPLEGEMPAKRAEGVTSEGTAKEAPSTAARTPPGRFAATLPALRGRGTSEGHPRLPGAIVSKRRR